MTAPLSADRLAEIHSHLDSATPGPWSVVEDRATLNRLVVSEDSTLIIDFGYVGNRTQKDAAFVATAPTDMADLLVHIAEVTSQRDYWQQQTMFADQRLRELEARVTELAAKGGESR